MAQSPSYIFCCASFVVNSASKIYKAIDILDFLSCSCNGLGVAGIYFHDFGL